MQRRTYMRRVLSLLALGCLGGIPVGIASKNPPGPNHLQGSNSTYLQRARTQPVDWYPWGEEAWQKARQFDRPILLDMGAVWCSWCALMDRESYTDPQTVAFINSHFVAVKVDYDAQPELARKLERAQAVVNLPAGLPLTAFVTPGGKLYFGGAYFPRNAAHGKPAFRAVLEEASRRYRQQRLEIERDGVGLASGGD